MKTVTIPNCMNPYVVTINNHTYSYPAGETVEVPDEVAAVIETHIEAQHKETPAHNGNSQSGGSNLETIVDLALEEAVLSQTLEFGKAYRYLEMYIYIPKAEWNTTNNNPLQLLPNGDSGYSFAFGFISQYGVYAKRQFIECFPEALITYGGGTSAANAMEHYTKNSTSFAGGLSKIKLIPKTSSETDMMPAGTHIIIRGREEL